MNPRQCYATPPEFYRAINEVFWFQLDAAADASNAKCCCYLNETLDALRCEWVGRTPLPCLLNIPTGAIRPLIHDITRVYCNPGFKNMMPWVKKAAAEAQKMAGAIVCVLGPLSRAEWMEFCNGEASEIYLLTPRIQFIPPPGVKTSTNMTDNVLVVFRRKPTPAPAKWDVWRWATGQIKKVKQPRKDAKV